MNTVGTAQSLISHRLKVSLYRYYRKVRRLPQHVGNWRLELAIQSVVSRERELLAGARREQGNGVTEDPEPLVSVTIATYNRSQVLVERTIPSVLEQTYQNFEIMVVGDHCSDDTGQRLADLGDHRIRYHNLGVRSSYPNDPINLWRVAGSIPMNAASEMARGSWIAHLDDDDVFLPNHLEESLRVATEHNCELVYGRRAREVSPGDWRVTGVSPTDGGFRAGWVPHTTVVMRSYLRLFKYDVNAWRLGLGADRHMWLRMSRAGVRPGFIARVTALSPLRPGTTAANYSAEDYPSNLS